MGKRVFKSIAFGLILVALICVCLLSVLQIAYVLPDGAECLRPDFEMIDLSGILDKDALSDGDYESIFCQTGLTRIGADRMLARGAEGKERILKLQRDYFCEHAVKNNFHGQFVRTDEIDGNITSVYLEDGDIVVTSSTRLAGWRIGHTGLVTNGARGEILQASRYGEKSGIGSIYDFTDRVNFVILSPKTDGGTKAGVVDFALKNLKGKPYNAAAGILTGKDKTSSTQCAHLVWCAYRHFGIDLDGNGGKLVTPRDIVNSPYVEPVQIFGFRPDKLWS